MSNSLSRKLTLLLLPLFLVGWGFYVVGLLSELNMEHTHFAETSITLSLFSPHYILLVGGPFIVKVGLFHAVLTGVAGSVCSAVLAILTTVYFSAVGAVTYTCVVAIKVEDSKTTANTSLKLMMLGLSVQGTAWTLVMVYASMYEYKLEDSSGQPVSHSKMSRFRKRARCVSLISLLLSAMSWCVVCIGSYHTSTGWHNSATMLTSFLVIHVVALSHISTKHRLISLSYSMLNMVYLFIVGNTVYSTLLAGRECGEDDDLCTQQYVYASKLVLIGGASTLIFWGCSFALLPFIANHRHPLYCLQTWTKARPLSRSTRSSGIRTIYC